VQFRADQEAGDGGDDGVAGRVGLGSGRPIRRQGSPEGARRRIHPPPKQPPSGDSGYPAERDPEQAALEVGDGLISREATMREYWGALTPEGGVDGDATARLRAR
jgi:hypothetical protein